MAAKPRRDKQARIVDAALKLAAERGWSAITLDDIAAAAKLAADDVYRLTPSKAAVLNAFVRRTDLAVLEGREAPVAGAEASVHDRLFDVLMRRFEVLLPARPALRALHRDLPRDPASLLAVIPQAHVSFARMLEAAGLSARGLRGLARIHALAGVWLLTQRTWFADDSADLAKTMAALDRNLRRMEETAGLFLGVRSTGEATDTQSPSRP